MRSAARSLLSAGLISGSTLALAGGFPASARADESVFAYGAVSETDTSAGSAAARETLVLRVVRRVTSLSVVRGDAATPPVAVTFAADGEIESSAPDAAVACYNMAAVLAHAATERVAAPAVLYFGMNGATIPVPVAVRRGAGAAGVLEASGAGRTVLTVDAADGSTQPAGAIDIAGDVERASGTVDRARFVETTFDATGRAIGRSTCALARMAESA